MNIIKKIIRLFSVLFFLCLFSPTYAQTKKWTLEDCIRHAIEHNITIKQIALQKENAEIDLNTAQMSRLPDLNARIGQDWSFGRSQIDSGLYKNSNQYNAGLGISASMPIFTGFRIPNEIARNKLELLAATENLKKAQEDLSLSITSLFLQALFCKELLKVSVEQLNLSLEQTKKTRVLTETGKVPESQLYDIEAQVAKDEVSVVQAKNNLTLALLDLVQSLELENEPSFDIIIPEIGDVIAEFTGGIRSPYITFGNAVENRPVIKAQEYKIESAEKTLKIAQSGYLPSLNLNLNYGTNYFHVYNLPAGFKNSSFSNQFNKNASEYIGLSLNIPIFNRFTVRNQVRSAKLNIHNQHLALENAKKTLYKEIQTAYSNATAAQEKFRAADKAVKASSEAFKYAKERYEAGKSSVFEFNEAKTKLIQSQSELIQSKYETIFRVKILDFYNGLPISL